MDWAFAIERHREPLLRIVAGLFAMIGLTESGAVERLSRPLYRLVLGILRPAESAVRRLIIVAARDIVVEPRLSVRFRRGVSSPAKAKANTNAARPLNCSTRARISMAASGRRHKGPKVEPRIHVFDFDPRIPLFLRSQPAPAAPVPEADAPSRTTPSMPGLCAAVSPPSSARWKTCRARRGASRAGGPGPSRSAVRNSQRHCASVGRRDSASGKPMRSMRSWPNATGSPAMCRRSTRREGLRSIRIELKILAHPHGVEHRGVNIAPRPPPRHRDRVRRGCATAISTQISSASNRSKLPRWPMRMKSLAKSQRRNYDIGVLSFILSGAPFHSRRFELSSLSAQGHSACDPPGCSSGSPDRRSGPGSCASG